MCARGSGSDFSENGIFAKTTTSDLIQKESAGSGPCQNNSEISRAILQGWRPAPKPSLTLQFPTGSGASPQPSTLQPHCPVQRGPEKRLGVLNQMRSLSLSCPQLCRNHACTHTRARTEMFRKLLVLPALLELGRAARAGSAQPRLPSSFPAPSDSSSRVKVLSRVSGAMTGGEGGHRHPGCCQVPFFSPRWVF